MSRASIAALSIVIAGCSKSAPPAPVDASAAPSTSASASTSTSTSTSADAATTGTDFEVNDEVEYARVYAVDFAWSAVSRGAMGRS